MLRIERLSESHVDKLVELEEQCFSKPWSREMFIGDIRAAVSTVYYGAFDGDDMVGYAGMWLAAGEGSITNIAVRPDCRRRGIASMLIHKLEEHDPEVLTLEVRVSNAPAICLYEKHGFKKAGLRKAYYSDNGEDAAVMIKVFCSAEGRD